MKVLATYYDGTADDMSCSDALLASATNDGLMSKEDKVKLDALSGGGGSQSTVNAADVVQDTTHRFVTDNEKSVWNTKASEIHNHVKSEITDFPASMPASDVFAWAKANTKPAYTAEEVGADVAGAANTALADAKVYADIKISELINGAPTTLDTLKEIADAMTSNSDVVKALEESIGSKANDSDLVAHTGDVTVHVTEAEKTVWNEKASTAVATDVENGLMSFGDKVKLDGIAEGANNYIHPDTHDATMIVEDATHRFVTDDEKVAWGSKAEAVLATVEADGLMCCDDKTKLDSIEEGANNYVHPVTHLAGEVEEDATHRFVTDDEKVTWNGKAETTVATEEADGLMSKEDKIKLNAIHHDTQVEPYYDEATNAVYACGVGITVEASETEGKNKVKWVGNDGPRSLETNADAYIFGGGDGLDKIVDYPSTFITINGGSFRVIYAGNKGAGSIGTATIIVNGGKFIEGINGGGAAYSGANRVSSIGHSEIIINNTDNEILTVYGGGMGAAAVVGSAKVTLNGGSVNYLTAGGSNGHTSAGEVVVNGGSVKVLQGCNRGTMGNIKLAINGGTINKVYAGGETEDKNVTATYAKSDVIVNGGTITAITAGTNGGVADASKVSGTYVDGVITDEAATAMNLSKVTTLDKIAAGLITSVVLEGKTLVLKNGEVMIASVDLTPVTV